MKAKSAHQRCNQDGGNIEWYTPPWITDGVREVMGSIDLDPASCAKANELVKATNFYTKEDNGLLLPWNGNIWMNHPFSRGEKACSKYKKPKPGQSAYRCTKQKCIERGYHVDVDEPSNADWIGKLTNEFNIGRAQKAACITFASTSENWFRPLYDHWQLWLYDRVAFIDQYGNEVKGTPKGCVITFMGCSKSKIEQVLGKYGKVK